VYSAIDCKKTVVVQITNDNRLSNVVSLWLRVLTHKRPDSVLLDIGGYAMMLYEDLPEEIAELFPMEDIVMPHSVRAMIYGAWDVLDPTQQRLLIHKMKLMDDPKQRALVAVFEVTKALLNQPPEDIIF